MDYDIIQDNLNAARARLMTAKNNIERMKALADIHRYEYLLANAK